MVHVNASMMQLGHSEYTQRNPARHGTIAASSDSTAPANTASTAASTAVSTAATTAATTAASKGGSSGDAAADFRALFSPKPSAPVVTPPAPPLPPTAESVFGANPWIANPGGKGPNGITYPYNPLYFATPATAAKIAQMVGGTVVETNAITPSGPFQQNQPNEMVQMPDGRQINAGILASFYNHGYSQQYVNLLVSNEANGLTT
jgi:hypothetical protein